MIFATAEANMSKNRILIAEDENDIRELIEMHLGREGHSVVSVDNGKDALKKLKEEEFQLAVVDWMLPETSGIEVIKEIRKSSDHENLAILMVTAKSASNDIILGLESGADDYLVKPFELSVLSARARALLRRTEKKDASRLQAGDLIVDSNSHEATCQGELLQLTPYEFKLLFTLLQHKGRVLTRDKLIQEVQGGGVAVVERAIDTHVFGLRKKLGPCSELIETVRGVGYRVVAKA